MSVSRVRYWNRAWLGFALGLGLLAGAVGIMRGLLLPNLGSGATATIWFVSAAAVLLGFFFAARDAHWLGRENSAIKRLDVEVWDPQEYFSRAQSAYPAMASASRQDVTVPLVVERAAAVRELQSDAGRSAPPDYRGHFRREAAASASHVASNTRFLSSALLLLAVIGTFAGMKATLPQLIDTIQQAGAADTTSRRQTGDEDHVKGAVATVSSQPIDSVARTGADTTGPARQAHEGQARNPDPFIEVGTALTPVADAFGANFLALVGALALGIAAYAAADERRRLLHRLDRISERRLYRFIPAGASADRLAHAVEEMRHNVDAVRRVGEGIHSLQSSIGTFEHTLRQAIEGLRSSFVQTVQQQSVDLHGKMNQTIGKVANSLHDVSVALAQTAAAYEGLVDGLRERDLGVQRAATSLEQTGAELRTSMGRAAAALQEAGADLKGTRQALELHIAETRGSVAAAAEELRTAGSGIADTLARHTSVLERVPARLETTLQEQGAAVTEAVDGHAEQMGRWLGEVKAAVAEARHGLDLLTERETALRGEVAGLGASVRQDAAQGRELAAQQVSRQLDAAAESRQQLLAALAEVSSAVRGLEPSLRSAIETHKAGSENALRDAVAALGRAIAQEGGEVRQVIGQHLGAQQQEALTGRGQLLTALNEVSASVSRLEQVMADVVRSQVAAAEPVLTRLDQVQSHTAGMHDRARSIENTTAAVETQLAGLRAAVERAVASYAGNGGSHGGAGQPR